LHSLVACHPPPLVLLSSLVTATIKSPRRQPHTDRTFFRRRLEKKSTRGKQMNHGGSWEDLLSREVEDGRMGWEFESRAGAFSVRTVEVKRIGSRQSVLVQAKAYWFKPNKPSASTQVKAYWLKWSGSVLVIEDNLYLSRKFRGTRRVFQTRRHRKRKKRAKLWAWLQASWEQ